MTALTHKNRQSVRPLLLSNDERGLSSVEYVVLLVLVVAASVGLWQTFGQEIRDKITIANTSLASVNAAASASQTPNANGNAPAGTTVATSPVIARATQPASSPVPAPATLATPGKTKEDR